MINREPISIRPRSRLRRLVIVLVVVVIFLLLTLRWMATLWTDFLWYDSLGQSGIWTTLVFTRVWLVIAAALVAFGVFWLNLYIADRISPRTGVAEGSPDEELLERYQDWIEPRARWVRVVVALFFGVLIGLGAAAWWQDWLLFRHGGSFGFTDPVFGRDIGLYVFDLPFWRDLFGWAFQLLLVVTLVTAAAHYLNGGIRVQALSGERTSGAVKVHLSILLAFLALLKAAGYQLDKWELLYSERGQVFGASFTDVNAQVPALNLLIIISIIAALILLVNLRFKGWILPLVALGLWLFTSIVVGGVYPTIVQRFQVVPDEVNKEAVYVDYNIQFTRDAYGLTDVEIRPFAASTALTADDIVNNSPTVNNIRLWDPGVLNTTYRQRQELRPYYGIEDVDVDRYVIEDELTQVMVSARELDDTNIPGGGWVNERLVYTHGFGAVLSPANDIASEGDPDFLVKDIPPVNLTDDPTLDINQERIYFSDRALRDFLIVGTKQPEVDFPIGTSGENVSFNTYDGAGGVNLGNIFRRFAWALRFGDLDTLISGQLTSDSRVLLERNIRSRVGRLAPFLAADADPYVVIVNGRLKWVQDLYTTTNQYPYSQPADTSRLNQVPGLPNDFNYIRNSVKAVIDAYDGTVDLYVIDPDDPLIQANQRIFPNVFSPLADLPPEIISHLRYPEDLFRVQTDMYRFYHVLDPKQFFSNVDPWQIARDPSNSPQPPLRAGFVDSAGQRFRPMLPYYLLMKLPTDESLSFLLMQPFTPRDRPNMVSFLVAKSGPLAEYGDIIEFSLPAESQIDGPGQVGDFINQDPTISAQFTLLGQEGSSVIQGNMLVVPIEESLLYVQPIYISADQTGGTDASGIPQFKRVVVSFGDQIEIADTLDEALAAVFGEAAAPGPGPTPPPPTGEVPDEVSDLLAQAQRAFEEADQALRNGDLLLYAQKIEEARGFIDQANALIDENVGTDA